MITLHTSLGPIKIELDAKNAPETAANFLQYAKEGFYDGTLFHRVVDGFVIQGGGYRPGMQPKQTRPPIPNEANNGLSNRRGSVAMARTSDPGSATSQFFINVADNSFLDHKSETREGWGYCVFGRVVEGMDVVDRIRSVKTIAHGAMKDVPAEDVLVERTTIEE